MISAIIFGINVQKFNINTKEEICSSALLGTLYGRFVYLVELHCRKNREVQFYSDRLHNTAKHLNQICKTNTGITASQWIQRYAKERIVLLPENKNLNISEISDEMGFPVIRKLLLVDFYSRHLRSFL
ncbi:helix-turn-helix domain-containing protein [Daejeonella oryzae]|uniref:helix-turn-helix domain-containing protein n=1 Tax=Daejeonella oryzae TaxID=1122943 RepID=UPI00040EA7C9|nr:helix-turn-helix domain-containing protein [Daejeonella oryzae]